MPNDPQTFSDELARLGCLRIAAHLARTLGIAPDLPLSVLRSRLAAGERAEHPCEPGKLHTPGKGVDQRSSSIYALGWNAAVAWIRGGPA